MSNLLELDPRLYDLARQNSIRTVPEALVELITNSYDAYKLVETESTGTEISNLPIYVNSYEQSRTLSVRDHARGLTSQEITDKILRVGSLTAAETSRGLMGRGAKDITTLGRARFVAIRDNRLSEVVINTDMTYDWIKQDEDISQDIRNLYKIPGNGLVVYLTVDSHVKFITDQELPTRLSKNIFLRNMLKAGQHPIFVNGNQINYTTPYEGKLIVDTEFDIEGYPGATATFKMYLMPDKIGNPEYPDELEYGITVSSSRAIYECGGLHAEDPFYGRNYRWNPNLKYIVGELQCDYIDVLAREISNGKTEANPYLVIDPARRQGLTKRHPFTIALYEIPYRLLEITINRVQDIHEDSIQTDEYIGDFLDNISNYMQQNLDIESVLYTWRSKSDQDNLEAIIGRLNKLDIDPESLSIPEQTINDILEGNEIKPIPLDGTSSNRPNIEIKLSDDIEMIGDYDIIYFSDRIVVKINSNDDSIKPFINIESVDGKSKVVIPENGNGQAALVSISDTLRDAIVAMMTRQLILKQKESYNVSTDHYNEIKEIKREMISKLSSHSSKLYQSIYARYNIEGYKYNPE